MKLSAPSTLATLATLATRATLATPASLALLLAAAVGTGGCDGPSCQEHDGTWNPVILTDVAEVQPLLVGRWQECGGGGAVNLQSPFEFTADGRWRVIAGGPWGAGTYEINTPDTLTIFYDDDPGNSLQSRVSFEDNPRLMLYGPSFYSPVP